LRTLGEVYFTAKSVLYAPVWCAFFKPRIFVCFIHPKQKEPQAAKHASSASSSSSSSSSAGASDDDDEGNDDGEVRTMTVSRGDDEEDEEEEHAMFAPHALAAAQLYFSLLQLPSSFALFR
jgi:hypothetical protein